MSKHLGGLEKLPAEYLKELAARRSCCVGKCVSASDDHN